jgi:outer membrane protein OmpA-like peptidoglycan-associated protein
MRTLLQLSFLSALACAAPSLASAQAQFSAEDVVRHFRNQGGSRAICIGTDEECRKKAVAPNASAAAAAAAPGFDLLINFEYDSDDLTTTAKENLDEFAKAVKSPAFAASRFVVEGHTDGKGSQEYNLELSRRRAKAVARYLQEKGVDRKQLVARGVGMSKPRAPDPLDPSNRRVEAQMQIR